MRLLLLCAWIVTSSGWALGQTAPVSTPITCEGDYAGHLQGVCIDESGAIFWSFTTEMVKTDARGSILSTLSVANHHGDLCYADGKVYVAVNLGKFNDPEGHADSWIYVYDAETLAFIARHETPEVFHGAGGMDVRDGHFYVVGGLPTGVPENYAYEYDHEFQFVKKHLIESGWTELGIQTADWHNGAWWFGCYGSPRPLLKTDADFKMIGRHEFDAALGIIGIAPDQFLIAKGGRTPKKRHLGSLHPATSDKTAGLKFTDSSQ